MCGACFNIAGLCKRFDDRSVVLPGWLDSDGTDPAPDVSACAWLTGKIPYFADENAVHALFYSIGITAVVLLVFGAVKGYTTGSRRERIWLFVSAVETLVVGALAAAASYGVVRLIDGVDIATDTP